MPLTVFGGRTTPSHVILRLDRRIAFHTGRVREWAGRSLRPSFAFVGRTYPWLADPPVEPEDDVPKCWRKLRWAGVAQPPLDAGSSPAWRRRGWCAWRRRADWRYCADWW